jgi:hypothetical protein
MKRQRLIFLAFGLAIAAYAGAYISLVKRGWPYSTITDPENTIYCPPKYGIYIGSNNVYYWLFLPIHKIDRIVRTNYWNPIVKDLAEQARHEGKFQIIHQENEK